MRKILIIFVFFVTIDLFAQSDWVNLGKEIGYDFYYKTSTIIRGTNAFVVIVGVPIQEMRDQNNVAIKYATANITFYEGTAGLRCIISNRINYYPDGTFIKPNMPKRNVSIKQYVLLMKLYEAIR